MTDHSRNEEREALIAGDRAGSLELDEAAELPLLSDLLADHSTWIEPGAGLEDAVLAAVANAKQTAGAAATHAHPGPAPRRRRVARSAAVAAAAVAIAVGIMTMTRGGTSVDFKARLSATALAPGARASVEITRSEYGFRFTVDARGLPASPPGTYYQAWLKSAAGTLVPIGTFSLGDGRVNLWSGVSPKQFPTMTVTIESTDNDQTSSGRRVLIGEVQPR